jgi:hypothetical protein
LIVRGRPRPNDQVNRWQMWQEFESHDFAHTSLQLVAIHGGVTVSRNDHADSRRPKRGSEMTDVEVTTPKSLPLSNDGFQIAFSRQAKLSREAGAICLP